MSLLKFTAVASITTSGRYFQMFVNRLETIISEQAIVMADAYGCSGGTYCPSENVKCIQWGCTQCERTGPTQCTKSWQRSYDFWYTRCQDYDRYTDGTEKARGGDYWCGGWGNAANANYPPCS